MIAADLWRSRLLYAAAAVVVLTIPPARAADLPPLPPPMLRAPIVQDFGGWYLRGNIGLSSQSVKSLDNVVSPGTTVTTTFLDFDSAPFFGLGAGYQLNNWFRFDFTGEYRAKANFKGSQTATFGAIVRSSAVNKACTCSISREVWRSMSKLNLPNSLARCSLSKA